MELEYRIKEGTACIDRITDAGASVVVPDRLEGCPVTELGAYVLAGSPVEDLHLPLSLERIGAYGFYGCESLRRIWCGSRIHDLGAGLFAGVTSVAYLEMWEYAGERSCFKELLSELRQTLRVRVHLGVAPTEGQEENAGAGRNAVPDGQGENAADGRKTVPEGQGENAAAGRKAVRAGTGVAEARLIFPEYYEESVENTPARILFIETHGCGHRYRYCFSGRTFQFGAYDELFPHAQVQEPEELVTELALGRLMFPVELSAAAGERYRAYVREHWEMAGRLLLDADRLRRDTVTNLEPGKLPWLVDEVLEQDAGGQAERLGRYIDLAGQAGDTEMVSWLMERRRRLAQAGEGTAGETTGPGGAPRRKRRFEL